MLNIQSSILFASMLVMLYVIEALVKFKFATLRMARYIYDIT